MASSFSDRDVRQDSAISPEQCAAAADPEKRTRDMIGNFADFDSLFEQLTEPALFELGNPLPKSRYLPKPRVGSCPAAHNDALLSDGD